MKIKKVKPLLNHILTTANVYPTSKTTDGLLLDDKQAEGEFKEYQTVIAVGPNVSGIKEGDVVMINPTAYARPVHKPKEDSITGLMTDDSVQYVVQFPIITINEVPHLFLYDRDCELVIEEGEFDDELPQNSYVS